jgi:hypothetical protein
MSLCKNNTYPQIYKTFIIFSRHVMSQSIKGIVKDKETGEPIQYAYVLLNGFPTGTMTNSEGFFKLVNDKIDDLDSLKFTHVGYATIVLSFKSLHLDQENIIKMATHAISLDEVVVNGKDTYQYFLQVTNATRSRMRYPFSTQVYFREIVKDNDDFSKFSDALLNVNYAEKKEDIVIGVDQSRVIKLPKETDDIIDVASPIDIAKLFEYQYLTILNRFQGDNRINYDYSMFDIAEESNVSCIKIAASRKADKNKLLYSGEIIIEDDLIRDIIIRMDTSSSWVKSLLGLTAKIIDMEIKLSFNEADHISYLSSGKIYLKMNFDHKKFSQINEYRSEFFALNMELNQFRSIKKEQRLKTKTLYKHGDNHTTTFWEGINIPILSKTDTELIECLKSKKIPN